MALASKPAYNLLNMVESSGGGIVYDECCEDNNGRESESPKTALQYARIILPHVGLIVLSISYIIGGAFAFYHLERPHEIRVRNESIVRIQRRRTDFFQFMWIQLNIDYGGNLSADNWLETALPDMENVTRTLFEAFDTHYISAGHLHPMAQNNTTTLAKETTNATAKSIVRIDDTWTMITAVFFTTTLLTTIGYGNLVPVTFEGRMFCIGYGLFGVPLILITIADIGKFLSENIVWMYCHYVRLRKRIRRLFVRCFFGRRQPADSSSMTDEEYEQQEQLRDEMENFGLENFISIPVSLILCILIGYIAMGALLLGCWEDWDFFNGFYFSFITMTTVGFGDIVPVEQAYFLLDLLYIIIGLAITTMCIDLVGIQYIRKIHYFGRAIKDARYALVNVGGKMVHVPDLMRYAYVLQQKYGLRNKGNLVDNPFDKWGGAFAPRDIQRIRYIDHMSKNSSDSLQSYCSQNAKAPVIRFDNSNTVVGSYLTGRELPALIEHQL